MDKRWVAGTREWRKKQVAKAGETVSGSSDREYLVLSRSSDAVVYSVVAGEYLDCHDGYIWHSIALCLGGGIWFRWLETVCTAELRMHYYELAVQRHCKCISAAAIPYNGSDSDHIGGNNHEILSQGKK